MEMVRHIQLGERHLQNTEGIQRSYVTTSRAPSVQSQESGNIKTIRKEIQGLPEAVFEG